MPLQRDPEQIEVHHLHACANLNDAHVLEVGCGDGHLTWRYAQHSRRVTAIDPDPVRLATALAMRPQPLRNIVTLIRSDAQKLPFIADTFDNALLAWSL